MSRGTPSEVLGCLSAQQLSNDKQSRKQDQNEKISKSQDRGLHTKQEGDPNENEKAAALVIPALVDHLMERVPSD
jgi:hypothetical protein